MAGFGRVYEVFERTRQDGEEERELAGESNKREDVDGGQVLSTTASCWEVARLRSHSAHSVRPLFALSPLALPRLRPFLDDDLENHGSPVRSPSGTDVSSGTGWNRSFASSCCLASTKALSLASSRRHAAAISRCSQFRQPGCARSISASSSGNQSSMCSEGRCEGGKASGRKDADEDGEEGEEEEGPGEGEPDMA